MGGLSTHALDLVHGDPAQGLTIEFHMRKENGFRLKKTVQTNQEGRTDELFLTADTMQAGTYQFVFHLGAYFTARGLIQTRTPIFTVVPVRFSISDITSHYHVPILLAPWGYTIYRGS